MKDSLSAKTVLCTQTMGSFRNYYQCGKPAKFVAPDGRPVCGIHKRTVNAYYAGLRGANRFQECKPL